MQEARDGLAGELQRDWERDGRIQGAYRVMEGVLLATASRTEERTIRLIAVASAAVQVDVIDFITVCDV